MRISTAFRLPDLPRLALVGAGGKSSACFWLARELVETHGTVIVTTSTHLGTWQVRTGNAHLVIREEQAIEHFAALPEGIVVITGEQQEAERYAGLDGNALAGLMRLAEQQRLPLLIEADGARMLPLKAPAVHEPAIPGFVTTVIVCAGLAGLGKPLSGEWVHRPEQFTRLSGLEMGALITPAALSHVLMHPQGGLKNIPAGARRIILLNQADTDEKKAQAKAIALQVMQAYHGVIIARLPWAFQENGDTNEQPTNRPEIHAVYEPIAGVILAAGDASRYGKLKQLLEWQGQPLVRHAAQTALTAGLSPVVVVTGAEAERVAQAVAGLPLRVVHNPEWQQGQSTSMQAGLQALPPTGGGAIFMLADQPNIPAGLIQALVEAHSQSLAPIVAPLVDGQRGNPVLFDPVTFLDLLGITGDVGGRQLFARYPLQYVPWHDRAVLLDVDKPEDYARLRAEDGAP
jgi:molybdenum cofactor cytidylyltransferase